MALYVTFFLLMGSSVLLEQRAAGDMTAVAAQPFASRVARALSGLGTGTVETLQHVGWWAHVLVFLGFAAYIPLSKHMHLVFATPNIYFFRRKRYGLPEPIDFESGGEVRRRPGAGAALEDAPRHLRLHRVRPVQLGLPGPRHRQAAACR